MQTLSRQQQDQIAEHKRAIKAICSASLKATNRKSDDALFLSRYKSQSRMSQTCMFARPIYSKHEKSLLQRPGIKYNSKEMNFVPLSFDAIRDVMKRMLHRLHASKNLRKLIASSRTYAEFGGGTSCHVHPCGRVIFMCECNNRIAATVPTVSPYVDGCTCRYVEGEGVVQPFGKHYSRVFCFVPHVGAQCNTDTCGLGRDGENFTSHMPVLSACFRWLHKTTGGNLFLMKEILGGPFSGYLQAVTMVGTRFCMNDSVRAIHGDMVLARMGDNISGFVPDRAVHERQLVVAARQCPARPWMNELVQLEKRGELRSRAVKEGRAAVVAEEHITERPALMDLAEVSPALAVNFDAVVADVQSFQPITCVGVVCAEMFGRLSAVEAEGLVSVFRSCAPVEAVHMVATRCDRLVITMGVKDRAEQQVDVAIARVVAGIRSRGVAITTFPGDVDVASSSSIDIDSVDVSAAKLSRLMVQRDVLMKVPVVVVFVFMLAVIHAAETSSVAMIMRWSVNEKIISDGVSKANKRGKKNKGAMAGTKSTGRSVTVASAVGSSAGSVSGTSSAVSVTSGASRGKRAVVQGRGVRAGGSRPQTSKVGDKTNPANGYGFAGMGINFDDEYGY